VVKRIDGHWAFLTQHEVAEHFDTLAIGKMQLPAKAHIDADPTLAYLCLEDFKTFSRFNSLLRHQRKHVPGVSATVGFALHSAAMLVLILIGAHDAIKLMLSGCSRVCARASRDNACTHPIPFAREACEVVEACKLFQLEGNTMPRLQLAILSTLLAFLLLRNGQAAKLTHPPQQLLHPLADSDQEGEPEQDGDDNSDGD